MPRARPNLAPDDTAPEGEPPEVLILAPLGADGRALARHVEACELPVTVCESARELEARLDERGSEAVMFLVVSQEGADSQTGHLLARTFASEPSWARLPTIFLVTSARRLPPACRLLDRKENAPPFILLERPVRTAALKSVFEAQAEARRRQFDTRDLLDQLRHEEERRRFLLSELRHRTRNSLAVLQALFSMTVRRATDVESLAASFSTRLRTLTDAHVRLTQEDASARDLAELLGEHVMPYVASEDQLSCAGPPVRVSQNLAFDLALVIHELATNAAKYGCLSTPDGKLDVTWTLEREPEELKLVWRERGGPPVSAPERHGLGTRLISSFPGSEASASIEFEPEGVVWTARIGATSFDVGEHANADE